MKLNLGSGQQKKEGFINTDSNPESKPDILRDIMRGLPFANEVAEEIHAEHLIEHLDTADFIFLFNECWRVLRDGGELHLKAPYYKMKWAYIDPSHKRFITEWSFDFFINHDYNSMTAGVTGWYEPVKLQVTGGEIYVVLRKTLTPKNWQMGDLKDETSNNTSNQQGQKQ